MTEKRFTCETKTQGSVSIDLMKDNGQIIEKFEAINLLNELNDKNELLAHNSEEYRKLSIHFEQRNNELISNNTFLEKENEQLKADNNRLVNETAKIVAEHQRKVFKLIDEKIDELEGRYKFGQEIYCGCPMHNIRFGINVLKELKRELQK